MKRLFALLFVSFLSSVISASAFADQVAELASKGARFRATGDASAVTLDVQGGFKVKLTPHDIRAKNYRSEKTSHGVKSSVAVDVDLFSGEVVGGSSPTDFAAVSVANVDGKKKVSGLFRAKNDFFTIGVNDGVLAASRVDPAVIQSMLKKCGADKLLSHARIKKSAKSSDVHASAALRELEVATDADLSFVNDRGGASAANSEILGILNTVDGLYRSELGIAVTVTYQHAWEEEDPFVASDMETALDAFTSYGNSNYAGNIQFDVFHLFSALDFNEVLGLAWVDAACSGTYSYGMSTHGIQYVASSLLVAHEIGHNVGSDHDSTPDCEQKYVMCPYNIGSTFSTSSRNQIAEYVDADGSCMGTIEGLAPADADLAVSGKSGTMNYTVTHASGCSTIELQGSTSRGTVQNGLGTVLGRVSSNTKSTLKLRSTGAMKFNGKSTAKAQLYFGLVCNGYLVDSGSFNMRKLSSTKGSNSLSKIVSGLKKGFRK